MSLTINCGICPKDKTEIKWNDGSESFHEMCLIKYNKLICPFCEKNLLDLDDKLKYKQYIINMFEYYKLFDKYIEECCDSDDGFDSDDDSDYIFIHEIIKEKIDYLVNNIDKIQEKFDIKTFLNIFNNDYNTFESKVVFTFKYLENKKIIEYCIALDIFNENYSNFVSNIGNLVESIDKKFIIHKMISLIHNLAPNTGDTHLVL